MCKINISTDNPIHNNQINDCILIRNIYYEQGCRKQGFVQKKYEKVINSDFIITKDIKINNKKIDSDIIKHIKIRYGNEITYRYDDTHYSISQYVKNNEDYVFIYDGGNTYLYRTSDINYAIENYPPYLHLIYDIYF